MSPNSPHNPDNPNSPNGPAPELEEVELTFRIPNFIRDNVGAEDMQTQGKTGDLWAELRSARELAGAQSGAARQKTIRDIYYDTPAMDLFKGHVYLRLRFSGGKSKFTLKGPSPALSAGLKRRMEIEGPVSTEVWESIVSALTGLNPGLGTVIGRITPDLDGIRTLASVTSPAEDGFGLSETVFGSLLVPFQDRQCERITRDITIDDGQTAELALDTVFYKAGMQTVIHQEIEVEAGVQTSGAILVNYGDKLAGIYGLKPFDLSKVATGLLIKKKAAEEPVLFQGMLISTGSGMVLNESFYDWAESVGGNLRG